MANNHIVVSSILIPKSHKWTHLDMCPIWLSEGISKHQQLQKKSAATTFNTVLAPAHIQMTL
jgi:hypothetical protein